MNPVSDRLAALVKRINTVEKVDYARSFINEKRYASGGNVFDGGGDTTNGKPSEYLLMPEYYEYEEPTWQAASDVLQQEYTPEQIAAQRHKQAERQKRQEVATKALMNVGAAGAMPGDVSALAPTTVELLSEGKIDEAKENQRQVDVLGAKAAAVGTLVPAALAFPQVSVPFGVSILGGATVDEGIRAFTPYNGWGDYAYHNSHMENLGNMDNAVGRFIRNNGEGIMDFTNPGYFLTGPAAKGIGNIATKVRNAFKVSPYAVGDMSALEPLLAQPEVSLPTEVKVAAKEAQQAVEPYVIEDLGGGYMLKSLMRGNPLEKQISKNGTVNVNNVKALIGKGSKVEQAVVDKVLASEEFAGKKSIDYNKLRKAVQDELITYERTPDTRWADYGMDRLDLDYTNPDYAGADDRTNALVRLIVKENLPWYIDEFGHIVKKDSEPGMLRGFIYDDDIDKMFPGWLEKYKNPTDRPQTFTFSSPRIPTGSGRHYDQNTLGHSRTYTTADEPDVLHVMESQSDWAQAGGARKPYDSGFSQYLNNPDELKEFIAGHERLLREMEAHPEDYMPDAVSKQRENIEHHKSILKSLLEKQDSVDQEKYLVNNYISRQIQENLRYAAEKGQTKMRYPTRETAAKIEGYQGREAYFDSRGKDVTSSGSDVDMWSYGEEIDKELSKLNQQYKELDAALHDVYGGNPLPGLDIDSSYRRLSGQMKRIRDKKLELISGKEPVLKDGFTKKTVYDYEDILRKYDAFPKQFKKLFKNAEVRTVTDPKGNTWYEVDVPENYLSKEWEYDLADSNAPMYATKDPITSFYKDFIQGEHNWVRSYMQSPERAAFETQLDAEARSLGYLGPTESLAIGRHNKLDPTVQVKALPGSVRGNHSVKDAVITIDPSHAAGHTPGHEFLHYYRLANTPSFDQPEVLGNRNALEAFNLREALKSSTSPESLSFTSYGDRLAAFKEAAAKVDKYQSLFDRSLAFRESKVNEVFDKNALWDYLVKSKQTSKYNAIVAPHELTVNGLSVGHWIGIKPFQKYPGDKAFDEYFKKAVDRNKWLRFLKHDTPSEKKNAWKVLSGSFLGLAGIGYFGISQEPESDRNTNSYGGTLLKQYKEAPAYDSGGSIGKAFKQKNFDSIRKAIQTIKASR